MSNLLPVKSAAEFSFAALIPKTGELTVSQQAGAQIIKEFDVLWRAFPQEAQDFILRAMTSFGLPVDYPKLPVWGQRAAHHLFFLCYPTLKNVDLSNPDSEAFGRFTGHLLAIIGHAKQGTAIFAKISGKVEQEVRDMFLRIEVPVKVLANEGMSLPPAEAAKFLKGLNHAFSRTFDAVGWPIGWNTSSMIQISIAIGWRYITTNKPTLPQLHRELAKFLGIQEVGDTDRLKKLCHRLGLRFDGSSDKGGTPIILDVPPQVESIPDSKRVAQRIMGDVDDRKN
ncbi:MAG TPA: hypothetical protein VGH19_03070 [Verrucomicrobiae bacterium]